ncbi:MAG TPA: NYN domain-containing protein [Candidatus Bathyarchaeia archaeon]|nr:NYN domain-containing protein [Candidatus Bathyarchaeia archaeon]
MLSRVGKALRIINEEEKEKIAIIFDGPTLAPYFRLENLRKIKESLSEIGVIRAGKFITDKQLSNDELDTLNSNGFQEEIVGSDVDIHVTLNLLEYMNSKSYDIIGVATTDANLFPIFSRIKQNKKLLIITWKKDIDPSMEAIADYILQLDYLV